MTFDAHHRLILRQLLGLAAQLLQDRETHKASLVDSAQAQAVKGQKDEMRGPRLWARLLPRVIGTLTEPVALFSMLPNTGTKIGIGKSRRGSAYFSLALCRCCGRRLTPYWW